MRRELSEGVVLGRRKDHGRAIGAGVEEHWTHDGGGERSANDAGRYPSL